MSLVGPLYRSMLPRLQNGQLVDNSSSFICRFLADRFVEGTCPFCNYEVILYMYSFFKECLTMCSEGEEMCRVVVLLIQTYCFFDVLVESCPY